MTAWVLPSIVAVLGAGVTAWAIRGMAPSTTAMGKPGIVGLQLAGTAARVEELKSAWSSGSGGLDAVRDNLRWDVPLKIGYVLFLGGLAWWTLDPAQRTLGVTGTVLSLLAVGTAVAAGVCDQLEDNLCRAMLDAPATDAQASATTRFARTKFALLGITAGMLLFMLIPMAVVAA